MNTFGGISMRALSMLEGVRVVKALLLLHDSVVLAVCKNWS
jgi:hypothetical protein